jgi:alkylation response protein AidB-like acyl-CoA dehydrogenase
VTKAGSLPGSQAQVGEASLAEEELRMSIREFVSAKVMPGAAGRDQTSEFPRTLIDELGRLDVMGIGVPAEFGGVSLPATVRTAAIEEIAWGDAALASIYTAHYLAIEALLLFGSDRQKREHLIDLAAGRGLGAFALTEPEAGSDIGSMRMHAVRTAKDWKLSGTKTFISNAKEASVLIVFAKTTPSAGFRGISAFIVPAGLPGVTFSPAQEKCGIRAAPTYTMYFEGVTLPSEALLGSEGAGGIIALTTLNPGRIDIAAMGCGIALRALRLATEYATSRRQFGTPLRDMQAVQLLLGEMAVTVAAARAVTREAAQAKDATRDIRRIAAIAKYIASEGCFSVVDKALQIHGGAGYMRELEIERLYRDCRILRIFEGTSQIQLLAVTRDLLQSFDSVSDGR